MPAKTSSRSSAAKKAAATRRANAAKRSAAAKKAAQTRKSRSTTRPATTSSKSTVDAISLIEKDHRNVEQLFARYEAIRDTRRAAEKRKVVDRIIMELSMHASIEENVLYPAVREALRGGDSKVEEALGEHQEAKEALDALAKMDADDPQFDQKTTELITDVRHHVEEEESDMLPKFRQALDKETLKELAGHLRMAKKAAPTRPHPLAPSKPPASAVAGVMAGVLDRIRDAATGRGKT